MLRKHLFGTTAALALAVGGPALAANTSDVSISNDSDGNSVEVVQSTGNNDSAVTIQDNSDTNAVDVNQVAGGANSQFSDVLIDTGDGNSVLVDQNGNDATQATITILDGDSNGSTANAIAITQVGNSNGVIGSIGIEGDSNFASINSSTRAIPSPRSTSTVSTTATSWPTQ